jgi:hypothetical protein
MATSGTERSANSTTLQGNGQETKVISKYLILPIIASLVVSLIVTNLDKPPSIPASEAHSFLAGYFNEVTHASLRKALYQNDLTSSFRSYPGVDWASYVAFWEESRSVSVNSVLPVAGNSLEFSVTLTYRHTQGNSSVENVNFWLVCTGAAANLWARVPYIGSCPTSDIKIDNEAIATMHQ